LVPRIMNSNAAARLPVIAMNAKMIRYVMLCIMYR
jgi:hypothetical protein